MADADGNRYGPYDIEVDGSEAEAFTEANWYLMHRESGVLSGGDLTFTGLTAHVTPIDARSHGSFLVREDEWTDASPATSSTSAPRRDLLVARRQLTTGEGAGAVPGKTFLTVLRGDPAATPADPDHDEDDDEPLWSWQVPGNGGTVVTDIRDLRRSGRERPESVRSKAERDALDKIKGLQVIRLDTDDHRTETWNGSKWCFRIQDTHTGSTDGNGVVPFAHGGGQAPVAVGINKLAQATDALNGVVEFFVQHSDATSIHARAIRTDTGAYLGPNPVSFSWWAEF